MGADPVSTAVPEGFLPPSIQTGPLILGSVRVSLPTPAWTVACHRCSNWSRVSTTAFPAAWRHCPGFRRNRELLVIPRGLLRRPALCRRTDESTVRGVCGCGRG